MPTTFANGTLTIARTLTAAQAQRLIDGVLGANGVSTTNPDGTALTSAQKRVAFDQWLWRHLRGDAVSWEARQAAATAAAQAETDIP